MAQPDDDEFDVPQSNGSSTVLPGGIITPQGSTDPNALLRQAIPTLLQQISASSTQPVSLPSLRRSPDDGTRPGWLGLLGEALAGGQSPLYRLSGQQEDLAGSRALMNFGINMMLASGPNRVRPSLFSAAAAGLQGAQESMDRSQQQAYTQAGQQFQQQKELADLQMSQQQNRIKTLQAMLPYLQLNARLNQPSLYGDNQPSGPGTAGPPAGQPGGIQFTGDPTKDLPAIAKHESGGDPTALNYVAQADPSAYARGATASGKYQIVNSTWQEGMRLAGLDPSQYATARDAPEAVQDKVARAIYDKYGSAPWDPTKWKQNWVPTPTGQFILAGRATATPAPSGATPAAPAQPPGTILPAGSTPPATPPGGPVPAPPGVAATGPYTGGGIGTALNPPGTFQTPPLPPADRFASPDQVRAAPIPAARVPAPPGQRADVGAMLQGVQEARAAPLVRGTGQEAGPSSAVATLGQQPTPQPGWGSVVGNYNAGPAAAAPTPSAPTPTPAVTPPVQPGTQQPTLTPKPASQTAPVRDLSTIKPTDMTQPEWLDYYRQTPTPQQLVDRGIILPKDAPEFRQAQADLQKAEAEAATNRSAAQNATNQAGSGLIDQSQVARLIQASIDADRNVQTARQKYDDLLHDTSKTDAKGLADFNKEQDDRNRQAYENQVVAPRAAALAAQVELRKDQIGSANHTWQGYVDGAMGKAGNARNVRDQLEPAMGMVGDQPASVFVRSLIDNDPHAAAYLKTLGLVDPASVDAQTNIRGVLSYISSELKPTGTGALREYEMNAIRNSLGTGTMDLDAQRLALARVLNLQDRIMQESDAAAELWGAAQESGNPTKGLGTFQRDLDTKLGPVIHDATVDMPKLGLDPTDPAQVGKWLSSGVVAAHRPVVVPVRNAETGQVLRNPNGTIQTKMRVLEQ